MKKIFTVVYIGLIGLFSFHSLASEQDGKSILHCETPFPYLKFNIELSQSRSFVTATFHDFQFDRSEIEAGRILIAGTIQNTIKNANGFANGLPVLKFDNMMAFESVPLAGLSDWTHCLTLDKDGDQYSGKFGVCFKKLVRLDDVSVTRVPIKCKNAAVVTN